VLLISVQTHLYSPENVIVLVYTKRAKDCLCLSDRFSFFFSFSEREMLHCFSGWKSQLHSTGSLHAHLPVAEVVPSPCRPAVRPTTAPPPPPVIDSDTNSGRRSDHEEDGGTADEKKKREALSELRRHAGAARSDRCVTRPRRRVSVANTYCKGSSMCYKARRA
jgi:hypothetical protein